MLDKSKIIPHWFADLYDQEEMDTEDVTLLLDTIGTAPMYVLEACCGTGRILVPLAKAGHVACGFDADEDMLAKLAPKAQGIPLISWRQMDAVIGDWGQGFDAVVLAGNILLNIVSKIPYRQAQKAFIQKAAACLKPGGHLYLDFNLLADPVKAYTFHRERVIFEGTDSTGVTGRYALLTGIYDPDSQMYRGEAVYELALPSGEKLVEYVKPAKHIPTLHDVTGWLHAYGFSLVTAYGNYQKQPIGPDTHRAILYAQKQWRCDT